jgi:Zn-dependent M28 family amino/carboxypeptidase
MTHLNVIASDSRAIGMPGHDATRDYLIEQLTLMGLTPELQTTPATLRFEGADTFNAGTVTNVIARLPGTASTGAVVINAHYDGGSTGPAAGDNGAAVAATLEIVRALQAGPPLANDLIIVFSDGEEDGDLGAAAFNQDHPWAQDVRLAINFEAQGSGGPAILYATSDENGWLTGQYFEVAPESSAYSLLPELVRQLPGMRLACDLEDYLLNGSDGLGFVFTSDTPAYHSERDSIANIDRGSIQQEGENTLAVVQHFGDSNLAEMPRSSNRVFFNLLPGVTLHYGGGWV